MPRARPKFPKLPKEPLTESSLPFEIGSKITIKNYNTFLLNHESSGYKFWFDLNNDNKTGDVYIIDMASTVHESVVTRLQDFFKVPNNGVVDDPPIVVYGQPFHNVPGGAGVHEAPDVAVYPDIAFVPKPSTSTVIPRPPSDVDGNPHARIMCEVAVGQSTGQLEQKCLSWIQEQYVRAVIGINILDPRLNVRETGTGYFFRTMTAKLYRQGMAVQEWDFGNARKNMGVPIGNMTDTALCNTPNDQRFQINIPISDVFWDPQQFPVPPAYAPVIPQNVNGNVFNIDLYRIQRIALKSKT